MSSRLHPEERADTEFDGRPMDVRPVSVDDVRWRILCVSSSRVASSVKGGIATRRNEHTTPPSQCESRKMNTTSGNKAANRPLSRTLYAKRRDVRMRDVTGRKTSDEMIWVMPNADGR